MGEITLVKAIFALDEISRDTVLAKLRRSSRAGVIGNAEAKLWLKCEVGAPRGILAILKAGILTGNR